MFQVRIHAKPILSAFAPNSQVSGNYRFSLIYSLFQIQVQSVYFVPIIKKGLKVG